MQTFADKFVPRRISQSSNDPHISLIGPRAEYNTDTRQRQQAIEHIRHFRLWNYIAIDANSEKASESTPNVAVMKSSARPSRQRQRYLKQFYPGLIRNDLDDADPVPDSHPLVELLKRVNDKDWWDVFCYETLMFYQLTGSFYWWVIPNQMGLPSELWVIPPHWIYPEYSRSGELLKWWVEPDGNQRAKFELPPEEVIYAHKKNPYSKIQPFSPGRAAAEWLINNELIEKARNTTYKQGNFQNVLLKMDKETFPDAPEAELLWRIENKFMQRYNGVSQMSRPIVMPPGMEAVPFGVEPNKMLLPEVSDQIRDYILALHRVPRAVAGISHDLNVASIHGANLIWCTHKIIPLQRMLAGFMTERLASRFDPRLVVWFDDCRPADSAEEREEVKLDWAMGAITPDERRLARNYPALETEASGKTYLPMNLVPLDFAGADEPEPEPEEQPKGEEKDEPEPDTETDDKEKEQRYRQRKSFAIKQSRRRARILRGFDRLHRRSEKQALRSLNGFWNRVIKEAGKRFDAGGDAPPPVEQLLPADSFEKWFNDAMSQHWLNHWAAGAEFERKVLGLPQQQSVKFVDELPDISVDFPQTMKRRMADYLRKKTQSVWKLIHATALKALRSAVQKTLESGEGVREMRAGIMKALKVSKSEATRIARTEATASLNAGQQALRDEEEVPNKQWIATVDGLTRETHSATDLEIVPNGQPFLVGGYPMNHPGDGSLGAPAEEIVNCRCCATGTYEDAN